MHLRRALLLFAVVLGLAAITASVSRPGDQAREAAPATGASERPRPTIEPRPEEAGATVPAEPVALDVAAPARKRVIVGQAVTLEVSVDEPGQVEIPTLGLNAYAEPLTPARFELLLRRTGRHRVVFRASGEEQGTRAGTVIATGT